MGDITLRFLAIVTAVEMQFEGSTESCGAGSTTKIVQSSVETLVGGVRKGRAQKAVKLLSWNDAYCTHSGPSWRDPL
jgi:hypothetical protein